MSTILIAEDNLVNRELLREMLEARNYRVEEARDGKEALAKIDEVKPDGLICSLQRSSFAPGSWYVEDDHLLQAGC
jgi:CheY-like chemotaxis protein